MMNHPEFLFDCTKDPRFNTKQKYIAFVQPNYLRGTCNNSRHFQGAEKVLDGVMMYCHDCKVVWPEFDFRELCKEALCPENLRS